MSEYVSARDCIIQEAVSALRKTAVQGIIEEANIGYPTLTSAVTARFDVTVETDDGATYHVPITVKVSYSDPVAID